VSLESNCVEENDLHKTFASDSKSNSSEHHSFDSLPQFGD